MNANGRSSLIAIVVLYVLALPGIIAPAHAEQANKPNRYPFDDRGVGRVLLPKPSAGGSDPKRTHFTYYAGSTRLPETAAPTNTKNKSHTIVADIVMPEKGARA